MCKRRKNSKSLFLIGLIAFWSRLTNLIVITECSILTPSRKSIHTSSICPIENMVAGRGGATAETFVLTSNPISLTRVIVPVAYTSSTLAAGAMRVVKNQRNYHHLSTYEKKQIHKIRTHNQQAGGNGRRRY